MANFDFTVDETNIGQTIGPANGYLVNLTRTQAGPYDPAQWSAAKQQWLTGRFVLRGSGDVKDLVCIDTQHGGGWASHGGLGDIVWGDANIALADLIVACVPRGSAWTVTLSDVPNPRAPLTTPGWAPGYQFAGGFGFKHIPPWWQPPGGPPPPPPPPKVMYRPPPGPRPPMMTAPAFLKSLLMPGNSSSSARSPEASRACTWRACGVPMRGAGASGSASRSRTTTRSK
jgi:hypothetical protein